MISLNGLMLDGSIMGIVLFVFVILVEILYCAAIICVIVIARRLKTNQVRTEQHLAEMLGFLIAKKVGFKVCEAEMLKSQRVGTPYFDTGVLSYVEKNKNDVIMLPTEMINEYRKSIDSKPEADWIYNIDEVINAAFKRVTDRHRPYEEFYRSLRIRELRRVRNERVDSKI